MKKTIFLDKSKLDEIKNIILESNREEKNVKDAVVNNIKEYIHPYFSKYLSTPLRNLPIGLQRGLYPDPNNESQMFKSVADNTNGCNRFIDFLRINLYQQFGVNRDKGPLHYLPGLSRIALDDLGYYSFNPDALQGGKISTLSKIGRIMYKKPEIMFDSQDEFDSDLNGLGFDEFYEIMNERYNKYKKVVHKECEKLLFSVDEGEYIIRKISDNTRMMGSVPSAIPTSESRRYLNSLSKYTDWCICGQNGDMEYAQYTSNGGVFYICEKKGFEKIKRNTYENEDDANPLDDYGLSLIAVLVGPDGFPDNITTRYNHDYNGENNDGLWEASQLQKILKVNYFDIFKPRSKRELKDLQISESKVPSVQSQVNNKVRVMSPGIVDGVIMESSNNGMKEYLDKKFNEISKFMKKEGLNVSPFPEIEQNWDEQDGLFIRTGYYQPEDKKVVVFCKDRHPKDILRSFAHEMIHHMQNLEGKNLNFTSNDDVKDNSELEEIEGEAYLNGNIYFRKWTEYENSKNKLNESYKNSNGEDEEIVNITYSVNNSENDNEITYFIHSFETTEGNYNSFNMDCDYDYLCYYFGEDVANDIVDGIGKEIINKKSGQKCKFIDYADTENVDVSDINKLNDLAKRFFDTVDDVSFADYILTDGTLLNVGRCRGRDHNDINIIGVNKFEFVNLGALRINSDGILSIDCDKMPTEQQIKRLYELISSNKGNESIIVDCCNKNGIYSPYESEKIVPDILNYFKNGIWRKEKSSISNFLYEEMNPNDVDLSSFEIKKELNPKFWKNEKLDSRIRIKLLDIADDFIKYLGVDWVEPEDIIITGSIANYNWNKKFSDVDLHVLIDYKKVDKRRDFVKKYFNSMKNLWNMEHENLKIYGFNVELYAQDSNEKHFSTGVYSLDKNEWINEPDEKKLSSKKIDKNSVKNSVSSYANEIDDLCDLLKKCSISDEYELRKISEKANKLWNDIKKERNDGLSNSENEISEGNLIYKCLRRLGYFDKIEDVILKSYDKLNSLK